MEGLFPYLRRVLFGDREPDPEWKLHATYDQKVRWVDRDEEETITFYLWVDQGGERDYSIHEYGYCKVYKKHTEFLAEVLVWKYGGSLPLYARLLHQPNVIKLVK